MAAVRAGVTPDAEPRVTRERLEEELRTALQARSVILRDEPSPLLAPNTLCFDVPFGHGDGRARLEILFETPRSLDNWSCQIIEPATHLAAMILELERATGRLSVGAARRQGDGAAPLIGSSEAIRRVREQIERVAATDFTSLIEGESGPEPHHRSIEPFCLLPSVTATGRRRERWRMGSPRLGYLLGRNEPRLGTHIAGGRQGKYLDKLDMVGCRWAAGGGPAPPPAPQPSSRPYGPSTAHNSARLLIPRLEALAERPRQLARSTTSRSQRLPDRRRRGGSSVP